ncbi:MAG TPA: hypothetical protein VGJ00_00675 [Rhabdochlamydiaceae bacterium]
MRLLFLLIAYAFSAAALDKRSSAPYLSGNTFRSFADFIIEEMSLSFSPDAVTAGSKIFVDTNFLNYFFKNVHPLLSSPYILITHNSDLPIPADFASLLDEEKLIAWFGQNVEDCSHPKLHPLPIGIANRSWAHGRIEVFDHIRKLKGLFPKDISLYMNFNLLTFPSERLAVMALFAQLPFCYYSSPKAMESYLCDLTRSQFVLSPRGNGLDTHRSWESLYMGAFPIVKTSCLDSLFEGLPVVIINDWEEVTESFLQEKYAEMKDANYQWEKLFAPFWFDYINSFRDFVLIK